MASLPTGTLTILFTDIEGSTRLLQRLGAPAYASVLGEHHRLLRSVIASCAGVEIKTEGDSFFAVFARAGDAVTAAVTAQRQLAQIEWPHDAQVNVRMGIHTGDVALSEGEYVGIDIHRAARISAAAHGGQVLLSGTSAALVAGALPEGVSLRDLGEHRLRDIEAPEQLNQLVIDDLPADFPPPHALATRFDLLPAEMSSFIGREGVLDRARELLAGTRLLTLTGPGGTGKTRLAVRLAREAGGAYADGVAFVPLASITDPELVPSTIRQVLGLAEQPGRTPLETLAEHISRRQVLLVLDNFEQVADAAPAISDLLAVATEMSILVTSRVALHLTGEQEYPVPPLGVPSASDTRDLAQLSRSEAVALFVNRAQGVRPDFALTEANAHAVAAIAARLDGLPLAIELAASRIKVLPPAALLERLKSSLDVLQSTAADRTDRQRTLRGAIDWSYDLLTGPQRTLFRRLSIFVGGFRLKDVEAVVVAAGPPQLDVLEGVAALVDNSLLRELGELPEVRFGMLETIREYGREQLSKSGEFEATAEAHARRVVELVEAAEPNLTSGSEWLDRLEVNIDNVRAALAWLAEQDPEQALWTGGRLWRFWHLRGHLREGTEILSDLLAPPSPGEGSAARAKALIGLAGLVYWQTDFDAARRCYEEALVIARAASDEMLEVEILYSLAYVRAIEGDYDGASRDLESAAVLYAGQGNTVMATWAKATVGMNRTLSGDHAGAVPILEHAIQRFAELGEAYGQRNASSVLSRALMNLDRLEEAAAKNRRVLELSVEQQDLTSISAGLHDAASLALLGGDLQTAARLTGAAQRIVDETGGQPPPMLVNRIEALPTLRERLPGDQLETLLAEGRALTTDQAIAMALEDPPAHSA